MPEKPQAMMNRAPANRLQGRSVLIVDDDEDILSSIELALRAEGAITSKASDGNAALSAYLAHRPQAVVLDMMLPKRSGFMVLEKLGEAPERPVVVMVTANQGKRHMVYANDLGVDDYFIKPVALGRLIERLAELCKLRDAELARGDVDDDDDADEADDDDET